LAFLKAGEGGLYYISLPRVKIHKRRLQFVGIGVVQCFYLRIVLIINILIYLNKSEFENLRHLLIISKFKYLKISIPDIQYLKKKKKLKIM